MIDPQQHLIQLPKRVKDPDTGQWVTRLDNYLEVKWRLVWFREKYPHGSIITEALLLDWDKGIAIYKATVGDGEGGLATGTGTETRKSFEDFVEKAETRSIGRALAALGIGTQFVGEELSEGGHVADAPVATTTATPTTTGSNGHAAETTTHPTSDDLDRLFAVAERSREPKEVFGSTLRRIMGLGGEVRITKKYLRESLAMDQFDAAIAYYETMLRQQVEEDVPDGAPAPDLPVPESTQPPTGPFVESSSAPGAAEVSPAAAGAGPSPDDDAARDALVREAMSFGLPEAECRHVVTMHKDLENARRILTAAARRKMQAA